MNPTNWARLPPTLWVRKLGKGRISGGEGSRRQEKAPVDAGYRGSRLGYCAKNRPSTKGSGCLFSGMTLAPTPYIRKLGIHPQTKRGKLPMKGHQATNKERATRRSSPEAQCHLGKGSKKGGRRRRFCKLAPTHHQCDRGYTSNQRGRLPKKAQPAELLEPQPRQKK